MKGYWHKRWFPSFFLSAIFKDTSINLFMRMYFIPDHSSYTRGIMVPSTTPSYQDWQCCGSSLFKITLLPCGILSPPTVHTGQSSRATQSRDSSSSIFPVSKQQSSVKMPVIKNCKTNHGVKNKKVLLRWAQTSWIICLVLQPLPTWQREVSFSLIMAFI